MAGYCRKSKISRRGDRRSIRTINEDPWDFPFDVPRLQALFTVLAARRRRYSLSRSLSSISCHADQHEPCHNPSPSSVAVLVREILINERAIFCYVLDTFIEFLNHPDQLITRRWRWINHPFSSLYSSIFNEAWNVLGKKKQEQRKYIERM